MKGARRRKRGDGAVYLRGRIHWICYSVNGKKVWESSGSEKESAARQLLRLRLGEIATGKVNSIEAEKVTVAELADDVVSDYRANNLDTVAKAVRFSNRVKKFFGAMKAHKVTGAVVNQYRDKRLADGAANGTVNRELAFIKRAFNLGIDNERISRKPSIAMLKEADARKGFFEYSEFEALRENCPEYFRAVVTFAYFSA